jgi:phage gp29-like protein
MKTAMQEHIEWLKRIKSYTHIPNEVIENAENSIKQEKQQIIDAYDLGIFMKAAPLVLWKKNAMGAWAEFIEKFGSPIRIGKTDSTDQQSVDNMEGMLRNMGVAAWGLFKTDDIIELVESSHTDAYEVFKNIGSNSRYSC